MLNTLWKQMYKTMGCLWHQTQHNLYWDNFLNKTNTQSNPGNKGENKMLQMKDKTVVALGTSHVTLKQVAADFGK